MAITFLKVPGKPETKVEGTTNQGAKTMAVSWLKTGAESEKVAAENALATEKRKSGQGKLFRFFLKKGEEGKICFVDGELSSKGYLIPPRFYEHFVNQGGEWMNVICPQQTNPASGEKCPICEGKDKPSLVSLFTVIDLRPFVTKDGKTIPFTRKLFVAKPMTFELLNKLAAKRGGLSGCVFDVSRVGDKSPAVGDMFDFQERYTSEKGAELFTVTFKTKEGQDKTVNLYQPADYANEIVYRTGDELRKMGFGSPLPSYDEGQSGGTDYSDKL